MLLSTTAPEPAACPKRSRWSWLAHLAAGHGILPQVRKPPVQRSQATPCPCASITPTGQSPVQLRASNLKMAFGGQVVLDGIDLELRQGEVVLLRGENGSGKTTLLNILTGNLEPDSGAIEYLADGSPRTYTFPRRWWQELNPFDHFTPEFVAREGIGRTWQDVRLFGAQSLRDNIAVAEPGHPGENPLVALIAPGYANRREADLNQQADAMLARLGLAGREESSADMISLGQSKRVAIARAVAAGAKILFLDEPLAGLDRQGIANVLEMLKNLVAQHNLTLVIVEHVFNFVHLNDLIRVHWELSNGKITREEVTWVPHIPKIEGISEIIRPEWFPLLTANSEILDEPLSQGAILTRIRRRDRWNPDAKPILEIRSIVVKRGYRTVLGFDCDGNPTGFNLIIYEGEIAILQAPNGWGKSTLFTAINGLSPLDCGEIRLHNKNLNGAAPWQRALAGLSSLPSDRNSFPSLRVREVIQLASQRILTKGLEILAERVSSSLSGGESKRVAWDALIRHKTNKNFYLLDEPFNALDGSRLKIIVNSLLKNGSEEGGALILAPTSHHN